MIGQNKNIEWINNLDIDFFPNFVVIVGGKGSGKTILAKYIANKLNASFTTTGIKVDEIRSVIDTAYIVKEKVLYCVKDADTMRNEAKNAMLKITEEPPKNAYFVMTVQDDSSLLDTIKSRAFIINMQPYSVQELTDYYTQNYDANPKYCEIATTPYELDKLIEYGEDFINFVELVVDNIADVEPANAFKSSSRLALKNDEGYDLKLFWEVFINICIKRISEDPLKYANGACETILYKLKVTKLGVNKQQLYDSWVFKIREVWN